MTTSPPDRTTQMWLAHARATGWNEAIKCAGEIVRGDAALYEAVCALERPVILAINEHLTGGAGMSRAATRNPDNPVAGAVKSAPPTQPIVTEEMVTAFQHSEDFSFAGYSREDIAAGLRAALAAQSSPAPVAAEEEAVYDLLYQSVYADNDGVAGLSEFIETLFDKFNVTPRETTSSVTSNQQSVQRE